MSARTERLVRAWVAAVATVAIVLGALMAVDQLVPPRDTTAQHCVQDQISGAWYCSEAPVDRR